MIAADTVLMTDSAAVLGDGQAGGMLELLPARCRVGGDAGIGVPDVRAAIDVVDRGRDVEGLVGHDALLAH